jgi:Type ISP C-terminal specificity domain
VSRRRQRRRVEPTEAWGQLDTRFKSDLAQPGLRIPFTADGETFGTAAELRRTVIWLHTVGERAPDDAPRLPAAGAIPSGSEEMPDILAYDESKRRLLVGRGYVDNVDTRDWNYEISGKHVLHQWFSYRRANRERPIIGDRRKPSKLGRFSPITGLQSTRRS